jgi:CubicO group peptidase (beta-lactamase class C family)
MTTGLDDGLPATPHIPDPENCLDDSCLQYLAPVGKRWAYHNAPYRLVQDVIAAASGLNINQYTRSRLFNRTGMQGFWFNYVLFGRARDMARFGLLVLRNGVWEQDSLIRDTDYLAAMAQPSQPINESYGYLWWLNGQNSFMLPGVQFRFSGSLVPAAPADMFAALGKNDQKIYVVPSMDMVVVRQGNIAGNPAAGPSSFDNELWEIINWLGERTTNVASTKLLEIKLFPNPANDILTISSPETILSLTLVGPNGRQYAIEINPSGKIRFDIGSLSPGIYTCVIQGKDFQQSERFVKR